MKHCLFPSYMYKKVANIILTHVALTSEQHCLTFNSVTVHLISTSNSDGDNVCRYYHAHIHLTTLQQALTVRQWAQALRHAVVTRKF